MAPASEKAVPGVSMNIQTFQKTIIEKHEVQKVCTKMECRLSTDNVLVTLIRTDLWSKV